LNKQTFIQLIKNPSGISPEQLLDLEKVVAGFPYCQSAYILIAKQAAETGSMLADQKLKKAAAYTLDRKNLKRILQDVTKTPLFETNNNFPEILVEEKILPETPVIKDESTLPQIIQEDISPVFVEKEFDKEKEPAQKEEKTTLREALTDEKREQIIKELQENLKRLHENKIKAAWEELPKEIKVIGVNDQPEASEPSIEKENTLPVDVSTSNETEKNNEQETVFSTVLKAEKVSSTKQVDEEKTVEVNSTDTTFILSFPSDTFLNLPISVYPIRTEDVIVEIKETEADADLLLEYINFLEEKRSIFRKNKKKEEAIIDKIIKDDPSIPKLDINNLPDSSVDLASKSITISKGPISENFAKILSLQGKREKAIEIYEQLILKNPEKKPYFEAQIEKLKNRI
jgi:tetratricopeptide (TPR) repeat protein